MTPEQKQEALAAWPEPGRMSRAVDGCVRFPVHGGHINLRVLDGEWTAAAWIMDAATMARSAHPTADLAIAELIELCPELRKPDDLAGRVERALAIFDDIDDRDNFPIRSRTAELMAAILRGEE